MEFFQSMKEPPKTECPKCHGELKRRVTAGTGLIFKGSGFYETDYKKKETEKNTHHHVSHSNGETKEPKSGDSSVTAEEKPSSDNKSKTTADSEKAA